MMAASQMLFIPRPPPIPLPKSSNIGSQSKKSHHSRSSSKPFHLTAQIPDDPLETGSIYSIYKQKIDSMFDSSDSGANFNGGDSNTVQAKIEQMFSEITSDSETQKNNTGCLENQMIGTHIFSIDYLGSVPLNQKVTSLSGLQNPLKELYFAYKKTSKHKNTLTGKLEISPGGLKVLYQGLKGDLEQLNPFPSIAVWSAVKFVLQNSRTSKENGPKDTKRSYAFLPLITDPDQLDKQSLFADLNDSESKYIMNETHAPLFAVVMRKIGLTKSLECHGFVCQTSEDAIVIAATLYKSLMAHMKSRDKRPKTRNGLSCMSMGSSICADSIANVPIRPPRKKRSTASSVVSSEMSDTLRGIQQLDKYYDKIKHNKLYETKKKSEKDEVLKSTKKSNKVRKAPKVPKNLTPNENLDEILPCPYEEPFDNSQVVPANQQEEILAKEENIEDSENADKSELKRTRSVRRRENDGMLTKSTDSGDILTKVTIPRSGSFLNAGGLTRYKSKVNRSNGQPGGSPLGFSELFQEFRLQEGLCSMDDILAVIINSEGMSFNDLKPIYKEFLLKLAVTLTKDELYQRSKSIMRRQKKKLMRREDRRIIGVKALKRVFRKSFRLNLSKRLISKKYKPYSLRTSPVSNSTPLKKSKSLPESSISTSSVDTRQFRPKNTSNSKNNKTNENLSNSKNSNNLVKVARKQSYRKKNKDIKAENARIRREGLSTSEDSDFFTMKRNKKTSPSGNQNRNSSSGYVSCSECSYDSDTCTCVSADKCYCSLGNRFTHQTTKSPNINSSQGHAITPPHLHHHSTNHSKDHSASKDHKHSKAHTTQAHRPRTVQSCHSNSCLTEEKCYCSLNELHEEPEGNTLTWCGCDTDSCAESNKCYCNSGGKEKGTIFEQLKRRGFIPKSAEEAVTPPSQRNKLCKKNSTTKSTKSVEYISNPKEQYYERLQSLRLHSDRHFEKLKMSGRYSDANTHFEENIPSAVAKFSGSNQGFQLLDPKNNSRCNNNRTRSCSSDNLPLDYAILNGINKDGQLLRGSCREIGCHKKMWQGGNEEFVRSNSMYGRAMSEVQMRNMAQCSVRSFKSYNGTNRKGKTLQATVPANSSTEALSVKKSAEIAALFTDLKLSQTTDITHLIPNYNSPHYPNCNISASNLANITSQLTSNLGTNCGPNFGSNASFCRQLQAFNNNGNAFAKSDKKAIVTPYKHISNGNLNSKMVQNSLYARGLQSKGNKNNLYSARNGLYTIQSQSDSSCSENRTDANRNHVNNSLENTLGYLP